VHKWELCLLVCLCIPFLHSLARLFPKTVYSGLSVTVGLLEWNSCLKIARCTFHTCSGPARLESRPIVFIMSSATRCVGCGNLECDSLWSTQQTSSSERYKTTGTKPCLNLGGSENCLGWSYHPGKVLWVPSHLETLATVGHFFRNDLLRLGNEQQIPAKTIHWLMDMRLYSNLFIYTRVGLLFPTAGGLR
jgi:hypothetical protein